jgi:phosphoglycolate phosphatase-like HAD superfamily hydrolase
MAKEFGFRELGADQLEEARNMGTREFIAHLGISSWSVPRIARRGLQLLNERIHTINPIVGIPEVLAVFHARGQRLAILSSNSEGNVSSFLTRHGLNYFSFVKTSSKLFGKAGQMKRLLREQRLGPSEVIYIGDETRDIEAAKEVGLAIAAVTWGYNSTSALAAMEPDHLLVSPGQLLNLGKAPE